MELTPELFVIPREDQFILYAPLDDSVLRVNSKVIDILRKIKQKEPLTEEEQGSIEELKRARVLKDTKKPIEPKKEDLSYLPTNVTLLPTYNCNLRCVYCYSRGGERAGKTLEFDIATSAIDKIIENAKQIGRKNIGLGFHGGGEPFLPENMDLIKRIVGYLKKQAEETGLKYNISSVTNGIMNRRDLEWITQNFTNLNLSLDGPEDIQNAQRPKPNNQPSFSDVVNTIAYLEEVKFKYGIRATVTELSVNRLSEMVEFFHSISKTDSFHLEPLFECGRCKTTKIRAPEPETYLERFSEAMKTAEKLGRRLYYSGSKITSASEIFCGASGKNFFVNPNGEVITCVETARETDANFEAFHVGTYNPETKSFEFYEDRVKGLQSRTVSNIPHCSNCFAKYNCSGDCPSKVYSQSGSLFDTSKNSRCFINRGLLIEGLSKKLDQPGSN